MSNRSRATPVSTTPIALLESASERTLRRYASGDTIFTQGDDCAHVLYVRSGGVMVSALSKTGGAAVIAMLGPGDFFGEGCLAGQSSRMSTAVAIKSSIILCVARARMAALLHQQHTLSDRFISHVLTRNIRMQEDLTDQIFGADETRLARALLRLARYGGDGAIRACPRIAEARLAEMAGTTTAAVRVGLERFRKRGFIEYGGDSRLTIRRSLLNVVLGG